MEPIIFDAVKYDYVPFEENGGGWLMRRNIVNLSSKMDNPVPGKFKIWKPNPNNQELDVEFRHIDDGNNTLARRNGIVSKN